MKTQSSTAKALALAIALAVLIPAVTEAASTVTFDNQSGKPALVKLVGPATSSVTVTDGKKESVSAPAGHYFIKVRYGMPGAYSYSKGDEFDVRETATSVSDITITLHKVIACNYGTRAISETEFDGDSASTGTRATVSAIGDGHSSPATPKTISEPMIPKKPSVFVQISETGTLEAKPVGSRSLALDHGPVQDRRFVVAAILVALRSWDYDVTVDEGFFRTMVTNANPSGYTKEFLDRCIEQKTLAPAWQDDGIRGDWASDLMDGRPAVRLGSSAHSGATAKITLSWYRAGAYRARGGPLGVGPPVTVYSANCKIEFQKADGTKHSRQFAPTLKESGADWPITDITHQIANFVRSGPTQPPPEKE